MRNKTTVFCIVAIFLLIIVLAFIISPYPLTIHKAERMVFSDFAEHRDLFTEFIDEKSIFEDDQIYSNLINVSEYSCPDDLNSLGIAEIYECDGVIYFEYRDSIYGMTAFGLLYAENTDVIDEWYRLKEIENGFFFYRIVS